MIGMIKGFLLFCNFDSGIFWGRKIWQVFFCVVGFKYGFFGVFNRGSASPVNKVHSFLEGRHGIFWGVNFWSTDCFGFGLICVPIQSSGPHHLKSGLPPSPPPPPPPMGLLSTIKILYKK